MAQADEITQVNRAQIEHRATWMGLIYDELVKAGIDAEPIMRRAIKRCGHIHGEHIRKRCPNPDDCGDFKSVFINEVGKKTFAMKNLDVTDDSLAVDFQYCALVSAWQKLGFDQKTCIVLCDMAMDGDRGIAEVMGLDLELRGTIASGCPDCKLRFQKT